MKDPVETDHYSHQSLYPYFGIHKGRVISMINISSLYASVDKEDIPDHVREHVEKGDYVLTFKKL
jgi:hypothetical protein